MLRQHHNRNIGDQDVPIEAALSSGPRNHFGTAHQRLKTFSRQHI
jgi:hypothetical protein